MQTKIRLELSDGTITTGFIGLMHLSGEFKGTYVENKSVLLDHIASQNRTHSIIFLAETKENGIYNPATDNLINLNHVIRIFE